MTSDPNISLGRLRQIGWDCWDPIGIRGFGDAWKAGAADEYDRYLLQAFSMLAKGRSDDEIAAYLIEIAEDHMALGPCPEHASAAMRTVHAIKAYLNALS